MDTYWTLKAQDDLECVYHFALQYSRRHGEEVLSWLVTAGAGLADHPVIGVLQDRYLPRLVRKVLFAECEVHYVVREESIYIVDIWHTKEDRNRAFLAPV